MKISATNTKAGNRSITVDYDKIFEKTETMTATEALEKNRQMFGDEVVNSVFVDGAVIWIQARLRNWLGQGIVANKKGEVNPEDKLSDEEIQKKVNELVIGVSTARRVDPVQAFLSKAAKLSQDKLLEVILQLKAKAQALQEDDEEEVE
jgi:hypothetical protein